MLTTINIAVTLVNEIVAPFSVAMISLFQNADADTAYDLRIVVNFEFSDENRTLLISLFDNLNETQKHSITFVELKPEMIVNDETRIPDRTTSCYDRLYIPMLFSDWKKCVYIDFDVLVIRDLSELWSIDIENFYVAGVPAAGYYLPEEYKEKHRVEIGIPSMNKYINAGVQLINLERIRMDGIDQKCLELIEHKYSSMDQDVINIACCNGIKIISLKYNAMTKYLAPKSITRWKGVSIYSEEELQEAETGAHIIHFCDKHKPWNEPEIFFANIWWEYAQKSPFYKHRDTCYINSVRNYLELEKMTISKIDMLEVSGVITALNHARKQNATIYIMGNGGSSSTASHFVNDLNKGISEYLEQPFRCICLNDNTATVMAIGNDIGFESVFEFQLRGKITDRDIVIGLSGSGNSPNVLNAVKYAKRMGALTIGFTGCGGGELKPLVDLSLHVPVMSMQVTEDIHMIFTHLIMAAFYEELCGKNHLRQDSGVEL